MVEVRAVTLRYAAKGIEQLRAADAAVKAMMRAQTVQATQSAVSLREGLARMRATGTEGLRFLEGTWRSIRAGMEKDGVVIEKWLSRNKAALGVAVLAFTGLAAAIIQSSPSLRADMGQLRLAFSLIGMEIGDSLAPMIDPLAESLLNLADRFEKLPDLVKKAIGIFVGLTVVIGVLTIAWLALDAAAWPVTVTVLIIAAVITALILIIMGLWEGLKLLWKFLADHGVLDAFGAAWQWVCDVVGKVWDAIVGAVRVAWDWIKDKLGAGLSWLKDLWGTVWTGLGDIAGKVWDTITGIVDKIGAAIGGMVGNALGWGRDLLAKLKDGLFDGTLFAGIIGKAVEIWDRIKGAIGDKVSGALQWGSDLLENLKNGLFNGGLWATIVGKAGDIWNAISGAIGDKVGGALDWGLGILRNLKDGLFNLDLFNGIAGKVDDVWNRIAGTLGGIGKSAYQWGKDILQGLQDGFADKWDAFTGWLNNMMGTLSQNVKNFFGIHSPSRLFMGYGQHIVEGFRLGVAPLGRTLDGPLSRMGSALNGFGAPQPTMAGAGFQGGSGSQQVIHVTIEQGAVQISGAQSGSLDEAKLADAVGRVLSDKLGGRFR